MWFSACCCCRRRPRGRGRPANNVVVLMLGLDNSGKTCATKMLVSDKNMNSVAPTVGFSKVETKYKGYTVTLYDLGGSKSFRSIWPRYYPEVHGFIFVVDSSDTRRMEDECRQLFCQVLQHEQVRGKPILLLCNKTDLEDARDEGHIVDVLNVERIVNEAKCPTRVEPAVAVKNQGLRVGYKWLVKSIIANMASLGPRVEADMELERRAEEKRRAELKRRIAERRKREEEEGEEEGEDQLPHMADQGFIPLDELRNRWTVEDETPEEDVFTPGQVTVTQVEPAEPRSNGDLPRLPEVFDGDTIAERDGEEEEEEEEDQEAGAEEDRKDSAKSSSQSENNFSTSNPRHPSPSMEEYQNPNAASSTQANGHATSLPPLDKRPSQTSLSKGPPPKPKPRQLNSTEKLELEPNVRPKKKKNFLRRLNRTAPLRSTSMDTVTTTSKSNSSRSSSSVESVRDSQVISAYASATIT